jgi:hypothetical protein
MINIRKVSTIVFMHKIDGKKKKSTTSHPTMGRPMVTKKKKKTS